MKKLNTVTFIARSKAKHSNVYDYSKVTYTGAHNKVTIVCATHGEFQQRPSKHLEGTGCSKCAVQKKHKSTTLYRGGRPLKTRNQFISQANKVHKEIYDYSKVEYVGALSTVTIICATHGEFHQTPAGHLEGKGCLLCAYDKKKQDYVMDTEYFISRSRKVHNDRYSYDSSKYVGAKIPILITCLTHGAFRQLPLNHYAGSGCPKCFKGNSSQKETEWLDCCKIPNDDQHRQVRLDFSRKYVVDGFDPDTNTVYEFWGDFWHGHPGKYESTDINPVNKKSFGELFNATNDKREWILSNGYHLVEMWESDWAGPA